MSSPDGTPRPSGLAKSLFANALLLPPATIGAAVLARRWYRARQRAQVQPTAGTGLRTVPLAEFDPVFAPDPVFGPTLATEVRFIGKGPMHVLGGTTDAEAWILAVFAKQARRLFEFGTCTGKTTYLWAVNSPPDAHITTLTLAPESAGNITRTGEDDAGAVAIAASESVCTDFLYNGTEAERKVTQLFGDSMAFDETPYLDSCDLVFVDGAHSIPYVRSDTAKALRMVRPGGVVLWHDYYPGTQDHGWGPNRYLDEIAPQLPVVHLEGTAIAAYRRPATG